MNLEVIVDDGFGVYVVWVLRELGDTAVVAVTLIIVDINVQYHYFFYDFLDDFSILLFIYMILQTYILNLIIDLIDFFPDICLLISPKITFLNFIIQWKGLDLTFQRFVSFHQRFILDLFHNHRLFRSSLYLLAFFFPHLAFLFLYLPPNQQLYNPLSLCKPLLGTSCHHPECILSSLFKAISVPTSSFIFQGWQLLAESFEAFLGLIITHLLAIWIRLIDLLKFIRVIFWLGL